MKKLFVVFLVFFSFAYAETFKISSPAFKNGDFIPVKYTCDGLDISPPLQWENVPKGTKSLVLIVEDPDAPVGVFTHWIVYDIPPNTTGISEGFPKKPFVNGIKQGINDFGRIGYGGPCPPPGKPHRYFFKLFALDKETLGIKAGATKSQVIKAVNGHIIGTTQVIGIYGR